MQFISPVVASRRPRRRSSANTAAVPMVSRDGSAEWASIWQQALSAWDVPHAPATMVTFTISSTDIPWSTL